MSFLNSKLVGVVCCLFLGLTTLSVVGQKVTQVKVFSAGTTTDSLIVQSDVKGKLTLIVKTYFEEVNSKKPSVVTQLVFKTIENDKVTSDYIFDNRLVDIYVKTPMIFELNKAHMFFLEDGRRHPVRFSFRLFIQKGKLELELL